MRYENGDDCDGDGDTCDGVKDLRKNELKESETTFGCSNLVWGDRGTFSYMFWGYVLGCGVDSVS